LTKHRSINPFSEAAFTTLKYAPAFPTSFGSLPDARAFCERFFAYYNHDHRHSGIALHTPASVHFGAASDVRDQRRTMLHAAYQANPARFGHRRPEPPRLPAAAWIKPAQQGSPHTERMNPNCLTDLDTFRTTQVRGIAATPPSGARLPSSGPQRPVRRG